MLFAEDIVVEFTPDEWAVLHRPITNTGGAQGLLRELHAARAGDGCLVVNYRQLDKAYAYAYDYGNGGFQDRFRAVVKAALRTGQWMPPDTKARPARAGGAFGRRR